MGVEMACEVKVRLGAVQHAHITLGAAFVRCVANANQETFEDKEVTLIHSRDRLVPGPLRDAFKDALLQKVLELGGNASAAGVTALRSLTGRAGQSMWFSGTV